MSPFSMHAFSLPLLEAFCLYTIQHIRTEAITAYPKALIWELCIGKHFGVKSHGFNPND